jgi:hypothetical protein
MHVDDATLEDVLQCRKGEFPQSYLGLHLSHERNSDSPR